MSGSRVDFRAESGAPQDFGFPAGHFGYALFMSVREILWIQCLDNRTDARHSYGGNRALLQTHPLLGLLGLGRGVGRPPAERSPGTDSQYE